MTDLLRQLHGYGEQLEAHMPVLEVEDVHFVRVGSGSVRPVVDRETPRQRRWLVAAAAGAAALAAIALAVLLWPGRGGDPAPFIDDGSTVPSTAVPTTAMPSAGLDTLAAHHAGPVPPAAVCPPGSTPDTPGDPGAPRPPAPPTDWWGASAAFDRESGLLVLSVSGSTWVFDPCWNRWEEMSAEGPNLDSGDSMVYDADSDLIVAFDDTDAWAYDVDTDTWTLTGRHDSSVGGLILYHDPSGLIIGPGPDLGRVRAYDVATDTLEALSLPEPALSEPVQSSFPSTNSSRPIVVYDPLGDHFYLYTTKPGGSLYDTWGPSTRLRATWRYDPGQGWTQLEITTPYVAFSYGDMNFGDEQAFDEAAGQMVIFSAGTLATFDPSVPEWKTPSSAPPDGPGFGAANRLVYDSANQRVIVLGGRYRRGDTRDPWVPANDVWAFDTRTTEWIELLPAG